MLGVRGFSTDRIYLTERRLGLHCLLYPQYKCGWLFGAEKTSEKCPYLAKTNRWIICTKKTC